jgi:hypothetical protein
LFCLSWGGCFILNTNALRNKAAKFNSTIVVFQSNGVGIDLSTGRGGFLNGSEEIYYLLVKWNRLYIKDIVSFRHLSIDFDFNKV